MGYSARYGGDTITKTRRDLEQSLTGNLEDARNHAEELSVELGQAHAFADQVYPALVRDDLRGHRIGIVAIGGLPGEITTAIDDALGPTGGRLVAVGVVREPVDIHSLAGDLAKTRLAALEREPDVQTEFATGVGRQLVLGGNLLERVRGHLFSRASGNFRSLDGVIVVRDQPQDMGPVQRSTAARIESALLGGVTATRTAAVGVEATDAEPSSISFFQSNDLASVDDIDQSAGKLATVLALAGAEGSFGVKGSADQLLPDLLTPPPNHK
jgi:hypothetical protein